MADLSPYIVYALGVVGACVAGYLTIKTSQAEQKIESRFMREMLNRIESEVKTLTAAVNHGQIADSNLATRVGALEENMDKLKGASEEHGERLAKLSERLKIPKD